MTGATAGIGKAIAKIFADNGMKVVLAARREELGNKIVEEIKAKGGDAVFCKVVNIPMWRSHVVQ